MSDAEELVAVAAVGALAILHFQNQSQNPPPRPALQGTNQIAPVLPATAAAGVTYVNLSTPEAQTRAQVYEAWRAAIAASTAAQKELQAAALPYENAILALQRESARMQLSGTYSSARLTAIRDQITAIKRQAETELKPLQDKVVTARALVTALYRQWQRVK